MISLDEIAWSDLRHAYGCATNIPALLRQAEADPSPRQPTEDEPWCTLWSALCHQGNVYSASFAAVPHFHRIATSASGPYAWDLLALPVAIEIARARQHVELPSAIGVAYRDALRQIPELVRASSTWTWDHAFTQAATAAIALSNGHIELADAILELGPAAVGAFLEK